MEMNCPKCGSSLEFTDEMRGELVTCGGCGNVAEIPQRRSQVVANITQVSRLESNGTRGDQPASEYLRIVRESSNYAAFRSALKIAEFLALGGAVLVSFVVAGVAAGAVVQSANQSKPELNIALVSVVIGYAALAFLAQFLVIRAIKQGLVVAIDMADMMADQGRRRH